MHRKGPNMRCHVRAFFAGFSIIFQNRSARQWMTPLLIGTVSYWQYKIEQADLSLKEIITMSFSYNESRLPPCCPTPYPSTSCPPCSGGTTSAQDPTGPQGPQGPEGPPQGSQGAIGLQGPQGDPGTNASGLTAYGGLYNAGTQLVFSQRRTLQFPFSLTLRCRFTML